MSRRILPIVFSQHARDQLTDRGATEDEIIQTIQEGELQMAKQGRLAFKMNFPFENIWKGRYYLFKQVMPIVREEDEKYIVVTVYTFFFGVKR